MKEYLDDIKKYDKSPNEEAVKKLANNLRLVMQKADARTVAASDAEELDRVVKNFAIKKLGVSEADGKKAVATVAELMKGDRAKNRVTFYYLVAKQLNKFAAL